jgi:hypothetical protein
MLCYSALRACRDRRQSRRKLTSQHVFSHPNRPDAAGDATVTAFKDYLALVKRLTAADINRSENDLSANLKNALSEYGLFGVIDTAAGLSRRKRPDIAFYLTLDAADVGAAADVVVESKKPEEISEFSSLRDALMADPIWNDKFGPYVEAHLERINYFILTTFESFLVVPISDAIRRDVHAYSGMTAEQ